MNLMNEKLFGVDDNFVAEAHVIHDGQDCVVIKARELADLVAFSRTGTFKTVRDGLADEISRCTDHEGIAEVIEAYERRMAITNWHDKYVSQMIEGANIIAAESQDYGDMH
jgi:hypothetical protein